MTRTLAGCLLIALLLGPLVAPVGAAVPSADAPSLQANNSTTQHVDPADADGDGNLEGLESHLARQLGDRLAGSSIAISQGQYDRANELLDDDYRNALGKYVDVAGETDGGGDGTEFREARDQQRDYANRTQDYRDTYEEYREARENGNEQRAREKARELQQDAERISRTSRNLTRSYGNIGNVTGVDMQNATETVNETTAEITAQQAEVVEATFVRTTLSVTTSSERISFLDPLHLEGRILDENGTAVSNQQGRLLFGGRTYAVQTNSDGEFAVDYRPVRPATGDRTIRAIFRPRNDSIYLGANATVDVTVEAVTPRIDIEQSTEAGRYQETVTASGTVTAANVAVPDVPVAVSVDGQTLATGRTDTNGAYALSGALPANVRAGDRTVTVRIAQRGRAIAQNATSQSLRVESTATNVSVTAATDSDTATLSGRLVTDDGSAVTGRTVEIRLNGSVVTTARTGSDGDFSTTVRPEPGRYRASVVYDEPGTNLELSSDRETFVLGTVDGNKDRGDGGTEGVLATSRELIGHIRGFVDAYPVVTGGVLAALFALVAGAGGWRYRGRGDAVDDETVIPAITRIDDTSTPEAETVGATENPLDIAERQLTAADTDAAVEAAYRAVRNHVAREGIISTGATHVEVRDAYQANGNERPDAIETLTEIYERAAFGPTSVSDDDAATALSAAKQLT